jgi:hypothetical protein
MVHYGNDLSHNLASDPRVADLPGLAKVLYSWRRLLLSVSAISLLPFFFTAIHRAVYCNLSGYKITTGDRQKQQR